MNPNATPEVQETEVKIETQPQATRTMQGQESRAVREVMKQLSMEVFGKSSRYQKLFEYDQVKTHKIKETVPGENGEPDTEVEKEVPLLFNGSKQSTRKYRSVEEVLQLMIDFKAKRDAFMAQMEQQKAEAKAKQEAEAQAKKVQEELGGSALT